MPKAMDGRGWLIAVALVGLSGCRAGHEFPFATFAESAPAVSSSEPNAFDDYVAAAKDTEIAAEKYASRTFFTPGYRDRALKLMEPSLRQVEAAGGKTCRFRFEASGPFDKRPYRAGWRLLGMGLVWELEAELKEGSLDRAIERYLVATRFGMDLTAGDYLDASLGYAIMDDARQAIAPTLTSLTPKQSEKISKGLLAVMSRAPKVDDVIENQRLDMLAAVDGVQEAFRNGDYKVLEQKLRLDAAPAIKALKRLDKNSAERVAYFEDFAQAADVETDRALDLAKMSAQERSQVPKPKPTEIKPWRRWAKFFFSGAEAFLKMRDRTTALTRLMAIHTYLRSFPKGTPPPKTLDGLPAEALIDPYTMKPLPYFAAQNSYRLYSVGADFRDDAGETNESFSSPDLTVENPNL